MKKQQKKQGNAFACLSLTDEPDPERVAKQQSKRAQKKLSRNSFNRQSDEEQQQQPGSPGLAAALAAIEAAERASPAPVGSPAGTWQGSAASSPATSSRWLCDEDLIFPPSGSTTPTTGSRPGSSGGGRCGSSSPLAGGEASRRAREEAALLWQSFAADCAAATRASEAADDDDDSQLVALSEADPDMFEQLLQKAADFDMHPAELLRLQQEAVMHEAAAGSSASAVSYRSRATGCSKAAAATSSRGRSASRSQPPAAQSPESEFPALSPLRSAAAAAQGRPQHAVPRGWKGGRLAPRASKGVTVLNSRGSSGGGGSGGGSDMRPTSLDLHWDLCLDGLSLKQDPLEAAARGEGYQDAAAHARRAAAAEEQAAGREGAGGGRDACSQETLRAMMLKAGGKAKGPGAAAAEEEEEAVGGGGKQYGYSWENLKDSVRAGGWEPVYKRDGAGGKHYKFRRYLPLSKIMQTLTLPCTPSDSQRGVRNSASNLLKLDREREELEAAARAAGAAGGSAAAAAGGAASVQRRKCR